MKKIFYTSDLHLGHKNIIKLCNRPFEDIEEMNKTIISNWNKKVGKDDIVYILGDFAYRNKCRASQYLKQLNGEIHLIKGNHDSWLKDEEARKCLKSINNYLEIDDNGRKVVLSHYPTLDWNGRYRGAYHVYAHIHNSVNDTSLYCNLTKNMFNAGVDVRSFEPVTLDEMIAEANMKEQMSANDKIEIGALYKIKEGKQLNYMEKSSPYVLIKNFISNPMLEENSFTKNSFFVEFIYVWKESLEPVQLILSTKFLDFESFNEYFELDLSRLDIMNKRKIKA